MSPLVLKHSNKNGHLLDQTHAMSFQNKVPQKYWGETILIGAYLIKHLPFSVHSSKTPMGVNILVLS
jgi:hypothetical protein